YDRNSNRISIGYPDGAMASYTFDYADREASLEFDAGSGAQQVVTSASYLPSGLLDGLALGNGLEEIRPYDSRYYPDAIRVSDGLADLLHWDYATDGVGNPAGIVDVLNASNNRVYAYQDYQYFLTQGDGPWGQRQWSYDRVGNRLTEQRGSDFDSYSYLPNAAMMGGNSPILDEITENGSVVRSVQYDAAGHQTQDAGAGNVIDRTYDDAGRLSRQERPSADDKADFLYDGRSFLRRAAGTGPAPAGAGVFCDDFESGDTSSWGAGPGSTCLESSATGPTYDSSGLLHAVDATKVLYLAGRPVAQYEIEPLYLTTDHLRTPIQATDGLSAVRWEGGLESFGNDYSGARAAGVFLRLAGQWDPAVLGASPLETSFYYNVMRWYEDQTGRYQRADPFQELYRTPTYRFAVSNPLVFSDALGLFETPVGCAKRVAGEVSSAFLNRSRYQHCLASCRITRECPGGRVTAVAAGFGKELDDFIQCVLGRVGKKCDGAFQPSDLGDNATGRGPFCQPDECNARCDELFKADEPPIGPFFWFNPELPPISLPFISVFGKKR
ncbi:MAG: RHS repeat-associated core domain-containing protein, partial [Acidobacteriota bacterium]